MIPVEAEANVSIRLVGGQDPASISETMSRLLREAAPAGTEVEVVVHSASPAGLVPADAPAVLLGLDAFEHVLGVSATAEPHRRRHPARLGARGAGCADDPHGLRSQRVERPLAQRASWSRAICRSASRRPASCTVAWPSLPDARFTCSLAEELAPDVLDRFVRYVRIDTQADPDSPTYPSSAKQLDLSRLLVDELRELGLERRRC